MAPCQGGGASFPARVPAAYHPFPSAPRTLPVVRLTKCNRLHARQVTELVAVLAVLHFLGRPALHQLSRVGAPIEKSSHEVC